MRSLKTVGRFLERLSKVKVNLALDGPARITLASICSSLITCLLAS